MFKFRAVALACLATLAGGAQAAFLVTYEQPGVTSTTASFDYVGVETFNSRSAGVQTFNSDFGTTGQPVVITGRYNNVQINTVDVYGGASNSNYAVAFSNTPYELTLLTAVGAAAAPLPVTYFGYWLSALDAGNQVAFYRNDIEVFSFTPADVLSLTGNCPASPYCGRPEAPQQGGNTGEPYVFLNFYDQSGLGFDKIRFFETSGGGYESDNHTVGFYKTVTGTPIPGNDIPEPSTLALAGLAVAGLMAKRRRTA